MAHEHRQSADPPQQSRGVSPGGVVEHLCWAFPAYFLKHTPTPEGMRVVKAIWEAALGDCPTGNIDWLVSEYALPVPEEWREEIGLIYRAPDFVCGAANRILIIELKTEWGSYSTAQITDFLRQARRLHPDADIDLILLEERHRGVHRELDSGQGYAEMTWAQLAALLRAELPGHDLATRLCDFLDLSLPGTTTAVPAVASVEESASQGDLVTTAIDQALHIAPALEADPGNANLTRGIDVPFASERDAREAETAIRKALVNAGHSGVSTWLWRRASGGTPATPAGRDTSMELRIQPRSQGTRK
jgi:hypothetical protein